MDLKHIPVDQLKVSRLNMRHGRKAPDIADILPSIRESGVRQSLLVRKEGKHYGVIAGRRRLFALKQIAKETGQPIKAPCGVLRSGSDRDALEASLLENVAHLPAGEFEQYDAFAKLVAQGKSPEDIAATFGVTLLKVQRILSLARLNTDIKALYQAEEIAVSTLHALTLASEEQQDQWLALYKSEDHAPLGRQLKSWLTGGARIGTDAALFDVSLYDGIILTDLFEENAVFQDPDVFWEHQCAAIDRCKEAYVADGWQGVVLLERGAYFCAWEYQKVGKPDGGKVFVECRYDGSVTFHEGYITAADARRRDQNEAGDSNARAAKPEMSKPMADYIAHHRQSRVRTALLGQHGAVLQLLAAQMIVGSPLWRVDPQPRTGLKEETVASLEASPFTEAFKTAQTAAIAQAGLPETRKSLVQQNGDDWSLSKVFLTLQSLDDADVMDILTIAMGETLAAGSTVIDALATVLPMENQAPWIPDCTFFNLLRDKRAINAMLSEIAGETIAKAAANKTGKAQKDMIRDYIAGTGCLPPKLDWQPRWMAFPATSYLCNQGCPPALKSATVDALLAEGEDK